MSKNKLDSLIEGVVGGGAPGTKTTATPDNSTLPAEGKAASQGTAPKTKAGTEPVPAVAADPKVQADDAAKVSRSTKKTQEPGDEKFEGDKTTPKQGSSNVKEEDEYEVPQTKAGMAKLIFELVRGLEKDELDEKYNDILSAILAEDDDCEYDDDVDEDEISSEIVSHARAALTAEDVDVTEDIDALMSADDSLTEDFRITASTLYEAAVVSRVNREVDALEEAFRHEVAVARVDYENALTEKVDGYLSYVVEEWMQENELAVERGLRTEITEDFIGGLKGLFDTHYIEIPDEKVDMVQELTAQVDALQEEINASIDNQIELNQTINVQNRNEILSEAARDLTDQETEKLVELAEGVEYEDAHQYSTAIDTLVEGFFPNNVTPLADEDVDEDLEAPLVEDTSVMANYTSAISRSLKK